jgi:hypothetical protein
MTSELFHELNRALLVLEIAVDRQPRDPMVLVDVIASVTPLLHRILDDQVRRMQAEQRGKPLCPDCGAGEDEDCQW